MAIWTYREVVTGVHGLLFGTFFLLAAYALLVELLRSPTGSGSGDDPRRGWACGYLVAAACAGWVAVLSGTFFVYPWYRAKPPAGADLHNYPRALLLANPALNSLHSIGMEWKEHIAFLATIAFTMLAYVLSRYGTAVTRHAQMRRLLLGFSATALLATAVAGATGALLNKAVPVVGEAQGSQGTGR